MYISESVPPVEGSGVNNYKRDKEKFIEKSKLVLAKEAFARDGVRFTNGIVTTKKILKLIWSNTKYKSIKVPFLENMFFNEDHLKQFVICEMGGEMGKGLFLHPDAKALAPGTVVSIYEGELQLSNVFDNRSRCYDLTIVPFKLNECNSACQDIIDYDKNSWITNAKKVGGITRYMQHAPDQADLEKMNDLDEIKNKVVTANMVCYMVAYDGVPVMYMQLLGKLQPGDGLYLNYGQNYFEAHSLTQYLFNRKHEIIGYIKDKVIHKLKVYNSKLDTMNARRISVASPRELEIFKKTARKSFNDKSQIQANERLKKNLRHVFNVIKNFPSDLPLTEIKKKGLSIVGDASLSPNEKYNKLIKTFSVYKNPNQEIIHKRLTHILKRYKTDLNLIGSVSLERDEWMADFFNASKKRKGSKKTLLIKKYKITNSLTGLEKGLRNSAANNQPNDLAIFIKIVKNIDANDNQRFKRTALHWAVIKMAIPCIKLLLDNNAKFDITDAKNQTAHYYAREGGNTEIINLFTSTQAQMKQ